MNSSFPWSAVTQCILVYLECIVKGKKRKESVHGSEQTTSIRYVLWHHFQEGAGIHECLHNTSVESVWPSHISDDQVFFQIGVPPAQGVGIYSPSKLYLHGLGTFPELASFFLLRTLPNSLSKSLLHFFFTTEYLACKATSYSSVLICSCQSAFACVASCSIAGPHCTFTFWMTGQKWRYSSNNNNTTQPCPVESCGQTTCQKLS